MKAHSFQVKSIEPQHKDGGVFVKFGYDPGTSEAEAMNTIVDELRTNAAQHGGVPSWMGVSTGSVWLVKGRPWKEVSIHLEHGILLVHKNYVQGYEPLCISNLTDILRRA